MSLGRVQDCRKHDQENFHRQPFRQGEFRDWAAVSKPIVDALAGPRRTEKILQPGEIVGARELVLICGAWTQGARAPATPTLETKAMDLPHRAPRELLDDPAVTAADQEADAARTLLALNAAPETSASARRGAEERLCAAASHFSQTVPTTADGALLHLQTVLNLLMHDRLLSLQVQHLVAVAAFVAQLTARDAARNS